MDVMQMLGSATLSTRTRGCQNRLTDQFNAVFTKSLLEWTVRYLSRDHRWYISHAILESHILSCFAETMIR